MKRTRPALPITLLCAALLGGCASRTPMATRDATRTAVTSTITSPERDGPHPSPPTGLDRVPQPEPRIEPLRVGGPNKPYEAAGRAYAPMTRDEPLREQGLASWYGHKYHGKFTSSGEPYDMFALSAAHPVMPIPSYARVRNPANGREVIVRVNDRGPFVPGRVIDLSYTAALQLGVLNAVTPVEVERITFDEIRSGRWRRCDQLDDPRAKAFLP